MPDSRRGDGRRLTPLGRVLQHALVGQGRRDTWAGAAGAVFWLALFAAAALVVAKLWEI